MKIIPGHQEMTKAHPKNTPSRLNITQGHRETTAGHKKMTLHRKRTVKRQAAMAEVHR
ncbi:hypothetical protein [Fulvivirga sp. M361]|uniref:hypothetical protein n=1 Tax=Fulvivirga sp. M361 TaxID=2594266 RepID=UPI00162539CF|nr:hypothetical protein [Fulvivirga sp. M361]